MKYSSNDFIFEEDFIISAECSECGHVTENENEFDMECVECGGELINTTSHEDERCEICGRHIDMWDDAYRHVDNSDILICTYCYADIESEEEP